MPGAVGSDEGSPLSRSCLFFQSFSEFVPSTLITAVITVMQAWRGANVNQNLFYD